MIYILVDSYGCSTDRINNLMDVFSCKEIEEESGTSSAWTRRKTDMIPTRIGRTSFWVKHSTV